MCMFAELNSKKLKLPQIGKFSRKQMKFAENSKKKHKRIINSFHTYRHYFYKSLLHFTRQRRRRKTSYLSCDPCMVTSRDPQNSVALHPFPKSTQAFYKHSDNKHLTKPLNVLLLPSNQCILHSHSQGVAQVQRPRHVWWRDTK